MSKKEKRRYASARERADKMKLGFTANFLKIPDGVQMFQPKAGRYLLDVLPYEVGKGNKWAEEGALYYERTFFVHRGVGANEETFICPRMTAKKPCPVCEMRARLMKKDADEDLIKELAPKERQIFNVINLKEPDKGVQLFTFSYHLFGKMLDTRLRGADEEDNWDSFFTLDDGLTLKVSFADESRGGYTFISAENIDFRPRKEAYDEDILEKVHCLDDLLIVPDYEDLKKALLETDAADEDDDEDDEDEKPKSSKKPSKKDSDDDEDESEDDDDEEEDSDSDEEDTDEEEDEKPKKKSPKDSDDDWDDFEDEKPKPGKKSTKKDDKEEEESEDDDDDEESEDEDSDEDDKPKKKSKKGDDDDDWDEVAPKGKKNKPDEDEEEEDDDEDSDEDEDDSEDEDDEDEPKGKKGKFPRGKGRVHSADEDE